MVLLLITFLDVATQVNEHGSHAGAALVVYGSPEGKTGERMIVMRCLPILWTILLVLRLILGRSNGFILLAHRNIDINCCFQSGMYALQLMDNYSATYSLLFLGIMMTLVLSWVYGECHVTWVPSTGVVPMLPLAHIIIEVICMTWAHCAFSVGFIVMVICHMTYTCESELPKKIPSQ